MGIEQIIGQPAVAIIVLLGALIFFHELGHFIVGRLCGVGVEIFSIGFGPTLLNINYKNTSYKLCLIPLGGYVKFAGSLSEEPVSEVFYGKEFFAASRLKRAAIIAAGPGANFLLAVVCYTFIAHDGIPQFPAYIGQVRSGSPADQVGIESQDVVVSINGKMISYWSELQETIALSPPNSDLNLTVSRDNQPLDFVIKPNTSEVEDEMGKKQQQNVIGVGLEYILPILTVTEDSPAFNAGLRTGMLLESVTFENGTLKKITSSDEIFIALGEAEKSGSPHLVFTVSAPAIGDEQKDPNAEEKLAVKGSQQDIGLDLLDRAEGVAQAELTSKARGRELATLLGISDSQLTIKSIASEDLKSLLKPNDRLIRFNETLLDDIYSLAHGFETAEKASANIEILRGGEVLKLTVPLQSYEVQKVSGKALAYYLDVQMLGSRKAPEVILQKFGGIFGAFQFSLIQTGKHAGMIVGGIYNLIIGNMPLKALGGPMMIAKVAGDSAKMGWKSYLGTMALISINLGVINLFPIPVLDGGQLLLIAAEAVKRRRLEPKAVENFQKIGFVLLFSLIILSLYNDLSRFWASMLAGIKDMF